VGTNKPSRDGDSPTRAANVPENDRKVAMPVALISGREDNVTPLAQAQRLQRRIKASTIDAIDGVGHIPHIEDESDFLAVLKKRLKEIAAR
jgi:pimeloyl-ACP methyl ester carboxylesterase